MPTKVVSLNNGEHYVWGQKCDGWHFVESEGLSAMRERMPPGASEVRHLHRVSRQFFYVLEGELSMEVEHHDYAVPAGEGIEVLPAKLTRPSTREVKQSFITVSQPPSHGDRAAA